MFDSFSRVLLYRVGCMETPYIHQIASSITDVVITIVQAGAVPILIAANKETTAAASKDDDDDDTTADVVAIHHLETHHTNISMVQVRRSC